MQYPAAFFGFLLVMTVCEAAVVQRRTYRNTEEILVPVAIIQDGEEIKEPANINELQIKNLEPEVIVENSVTDVSQEQKLEAIEAVVEAERRIDEAIVEEEIKEAVQEEQDKELIQALEEKNKLKATTTTIVEIPQTVSVIQTEINEAVKENVKEEDEEEADKVQDISDNKSVVVETQSPNQVIVIVEAANEAGNNEGAEQPEGSVRQATQATPAQTTTQQNFVQQLIQNSPLGQFFNQITGQTTQGQVANDETAQAPSPTLPGLFNPVTAVQNAAQSVVNSTTQAFQGLQQFASNLGNQFQSTLSSLGGQQQDQAATTARPAGPIQQLVSTFIGTPQQTQPAPTQQGPLQGLLNIFQGNNRPQGSAGSTNNNSQPAKEPAIQEETEAAAADTNPAAAAAEATGYNSEQINNEVRDSGEANDSFEETVKPNELIVVNDDNSPTGNYQLRKVANVSK